MRIFEEYVPPEAPCAAETAFKRNLRFRSTWTRVDIPGEPYCDKPVPVSLSRRSGRGKIGLEVNLRAPCRKCDKCRRFRQLRWRERALAELSAVSRSWLITLTFNPVHLAGVLAEAALLPEGMDRDVRIERAAYAHVDRYFKRLRKAGHKFRYLAVYEYGEENGRLHYHILFHETAMPVFKRQLQEQWISFSNCSLIRSKAGGASYVTKYLLKSLRRPRASGYYGRTTPLPVPMEMGTISPEMTYPNSEAGMTDACDKEAVFGVADDKERIVAGISLRSAL